MEIEYEIVAKEQLTDVVRATFATALELQGKVQGDLCKKADRCKLLCIARIDGEVAGIGAIKIKTSSDFSEEKAALPELSAHFEWELGYLYTRPDQTGKGIAKNIARLLVDSYGDGNLMASTEVSANPAMVKILEQLGFRMHGKPWKSKIHENHLALFLKYDKKYRR